MAKRRTKRGDLLAPAWELTNSLSESQSARLSLVRGPLRPAPEASDRNDRRGQLDARPPRGLRADRAQGGRGPRDGRMLCLSLRRGGERARPASLLRHEGGGAHSRPEDAP